MANWHALLVAISFMTRLPVPVSWLPQQYNPQLQSRAALFYPAVGAVIGLLLVLLTVLLSNGINAGVQAVLVVVAWVGLTGALHLDGLADCVDAQAAAHSNPDLLHTVLKDPHVGAAGACALVLAILTKVALVAAALQQNSEVLALVGAPVAGRLLALLYMWSTPYVRKQGLAADIQLQSLQIAIAAVFLLVLMLGLLVLGPTAALWLAAVLGLWLFYWRRRWLRLFGGYSGDCVGALIEVAELLTLLVMVTAL